MSAASATPDGAGRAGRGGITPRMAVNAIRRRPFTVMLVLLLAAGSGAAVWFFLPLPKMTAVATVHVAYQAPALLSPTAEGRIDFASYKSAQMAAVKRHLNLSTALKQPGVSELSMLRGEADQVAWLDRRLTVESKLGSEFIKVSIEGDSGDEMVTLLAAVVKAYMDDHDERENGARRKRLAKLDDTYRDKKAELDRHRKRIDTIAYALGSKDGPTLMVMDSLNQEELRAANRDLTTAREQLRVAELEFGAAADPAGPPPAAATIPDTLVDDELRKEPAFLDLEAGVARAKASLAATEKLFEPGVVTPAVSKAKADLAAAEERRDKFKAAARPKVEAALQGRLKVNGQARQQALDQLKRRVEAAQARTDEIQQKIAKSNVYRVELENLKKEIEQIEKMSTRLAEEIEQIRVELGAPPRVTVSDEPYIMAGIEGNRRLKYTAIAVAGVLLVGLAGVVGLEARSRRLTHAAEVTDDLGMKYLGSIPPVVVANGKAESAVQPGILVEAVDAVRTMLLHGADRGQKLKTLVVTSAVAQEGKTSFSGHLAISLARAGYRTLLVDGDLKSPSADQLYNLSRGPGLCEILRGEADPAGAVRPSPIPGLSILTAGTWSLAARQALLGDGWQKAQAGLDQQYDYVVIDTSPLLLVSDTLHFARQADGVIVAVRHGYSRLSLVADAASRLQTVGANVTGVVVNGVWNDAFRSEYGGYYGYGYAYLATEPAEPAVGGEAAVANGRVGV